MLVKTEKRAWISGEDGAQGSLGQKGDRTEKLFHLYK